jgi:phosphatidylglycerophosphate synthase
MTLNTIDGVMAIQRGKHTLTGEIVNALPDRYSDIFVVGGIALSSLCRDWLGLVALATVFLVSYTGMLGKAIGVAWQHQGPMGKVERLITIMVFALFQFFLLPEPQFVTIAGITVTPMEIAMGLFVVLGQYSVLRRLKGQIGEINHKEEERGQAIGARAIVIYDSSTGNTRQVAIEIAKGIGCTAKQVSCHIRSSTVSGSFCYLWITSMGPSYHACVLAIYGQEVEYESGSTVHMPWLPPEI